MKVLVISERAKGAKEMSGLGDSCAKHTYLETVCIELSQSHKQKLIEATAT